MSVFIVLCGGRGERLRSVVSDRPKVLAEVGGRPFLDHLLDHLSAFRPEEIVLSTGYRADMVEDYVGLRGAGPVPVRCVAEAEPLGTAGAVRHVAGQVDVSDPFFVMNGDTWFDGNPDLLAGFHATCGATASLALVKVPDGSRYGQVEADPDDGAVRSFVEKAERSGSGWINAGMYCLSPAVLDLIPQGRACSIERDVFPRLIGDGLFARRFTDATFLDIGTPEDFDRAQELFGDSSDGSE